MDYYIGQTFEGTYPPEAAMWCNTHNAFIKVIDNKFTICEYVKSREAKVAEIQQNILFLESKQPRCMREILLGKGDVPDAEGVTPNQRFNRINDDIEALRSTLKYL